MSEFEKFSSDDRYLIEKAKALAQTFHKEQKRKYTFEPYFTHLERVALDVLRRGGNAFQVAAGFGHDLLEDTNITHQQLFDAVGSLPYLYIVWLTNPSKQIKGSNRMVRKSLDATWLHYAPPEVKFIKLCDRLDNIRDMKLADAEFKIKYCTESMNLLNEIGMAYGQISKDLFEAIKELEQTAKPAV